MIIIAAEQQGMLKPPGVEVSGQIQTGGNRIDSSIITENDCDSPDG